MSGDTVLTASVLALDIVFLPSLLRNSTRVAAVTAFGYAVILGLGGIGFQANEQWGPFIAQSIGMVEWLLLGVKMLVRPRYL